MLTQILLLWLITSLAATYALLQQNREPSSMIIWLFVSWTIPFLGPALFLFVGPQRLERAAFRRQTKIEKRLADLGQEASSIDRGSEAEPLPVDSQPIFQLTQELSSYPVTTANQVGVYGQANAGLEAMVQAIEGAKSYVHLEYYIIDQDEVTDRLLKALESALDRGVEVRILYDALGSLSLKRRYFQKLLKKGAKVAGFLPLSAITKRFNLNFRNHRKILVIDGVHAFTGSANIGRRYLGKRSKTSWRESVVHVEGPAVLQLEDVFAKDWHFTTRANLFTAKYYPEPENAGNLAAQVLDSGPDSKFEILHKALFMAITMAKKEVLITTPYFVPDSAMLAAITTAALRGVRVVLILPSKNDSRFVQFASRSYYEKLLSAGVEIYEYQPRVMHSKAMVIDDNWSVLGSFNMDIRSFRLNFEINLLTFGKTVADQVREVMRSDLSHSQRVDEESFRLRSTLTRMTENLCRLWAPFL